MKGKGVHLPVRELIEDELAAQGTIQRVAWLPQEASGTIGVIGDRRGIAKGLIRGTVRLPDVFTHPAAIQLHVLVLIPPTRIGTFDDVD